MAKFQRNEERSFTLAFVSYDGGDIMKPIVREVIVTARTMKEARRKAKQKLKE